MNIITPGQFSFAWLKDLKEQKRNPGNPGTRKKIRYKDIITAFDIETTRLEDIEQSIMYIWQWAFGPDLVVIGRTWDEFTLFCNNINNVLKEDERLICFVHNLSFEFQFLKGIHHFEPEDVFCTDSRKILKCQIGKIEMRCSYLHSNMSLKEYTEKMGAEHSKLSGIEFDYSKKRFPWTDMTLSELKYCINDVVGLVEAVQIEMAHDHDTIYSFPLTSTGYVRRDAKRALQAIDHTWIRRGAPDFHVYTLLREAFRGGNTHASRYAAGHLLEFKSSYIHSVDRSSSYPDVLVNHLYPEGRFHEVGRCSAFKFNELYNVMGRAMVFRARFFGIKLKNRLEGVPYIPKDKCRNLLGSVNDNGRVLMADCLEITLTDVDYRIIEDMYTWEDVSYLDVCYTRYRALPKPFTDLINEYYRRKTELKGIEGAELDYFRAKAKLNSLYGMCAQDPIKQSILYQNDQYILDDQDPEKLLAQNNAHRQLPNYQVGCWCTAWSRYELQRCIKKVQDTKGAFFIYTDTDSIKYAGEVDFSDYNAEKINDSKKHGAYAKDPKGTTHYMGVFEREWDSEAINFKTLGAKKYAYTDLNGKLHITVAGVIKKEGAKEMEKDGGIKAFDLGYVFVEGGGLEAVYNDDPEIKEYNIEGHTLKITSNVVLRPSTYTLGITNEYEALLADSNYMPLD